jgi:hypothetical protein
VPWPFSAQRQTGTKGRRVSSRGSRGATGSLEVRVAELGSACGAFDDGDSLSQLRPVDASLDRVDREPGRRGAMCAPRMPDRVRSPGSCDQARSRTRGHSTFHQRSGEKGTIGPRPSLSLRLPPARPGWLPGALGACEDPGLRAAAWLGTSERQPAPGARACFSRYLGKVLVPLGATPRVDHG